MSSQQQQQQIKLNQLNSILSTNNNNSSNQQKLNETEAISKEVNLWQIRELAIADGGLLNGTFVFILYLYIVLLGGRVLVYCCVFYSFLFGVFVCCVFWYMIVVSFFSRLGVVCYIGLVEVGGSLRQAFGGVFKGDMFGKVC